MKRVWSGQDLTRLNTVKQVKKIENYRGYKRCLVLTPNSNPYFHCGYLDSQFFAYVSSGYNLYETPEQVIDNYLKIPEIFRNSSLEYDIFRKEYKLYMNSVKIAYESIIKPTKKSCQ